MKRIAPRRRAVATAVLAVLSIAAAARGAGGATVQRFTLVIGANEAGPDRPQLRYAVTDAERFARVLVELGGVTRDNEIVLRQPKLRDLMAALDLLQARVARARSARGDSAEGAGRTEVLVYYSGHADEQGLLLGDDRYSYRSLRARSIRFPPTFASRSSTRARPARSRGSRAARPARRSSSISRRTCAATPS